MVGLVSAAIPVGIGTAATHGGAEVMVVSATASGGRDEESHMAVASCPVGGGGCCTIRCMAAAGLMSASRAVERTAYTVAG